MEKKKSSEGKNDPIWHANILMLWKTEQVINHATTWRLSLPNKLLWAKAHLVVNYFNKEINLVGNEACIQKKNLICAAAGLLNGKGIRKYHIGQLCCRFQVRSQACALCISYIQVVLDVYRICH